MKKTINFSLAGQSFVAEEDAYNRLDSYLKEVKSHFENNEADEITGDIEARFAEQFMQKQLDGQVVTLTDVEKVIGIMGSPEEFGDESPRQKTSYQEKSSSGVRRYYRDPDDVIIGGVASGLAAYVGIDPVWVRLVFFLSIFAGGTGILIYILLWIIVPEAKNETEKLQMRGQPITLKTLEQNVKDKAEELKSNRGNIKQRTSGPLRALGTLVRTIALIIARLLKIIVKIIGAALVASGVAAAAFAVFGFITALFNSNSPYVDIPIKALANTGWFYGGLIAGFIFILLPLVALILLGLSMVSGHSLFKKVAGFSLLGVWIVAAAVAANAGFKIAPKFEEAINNDPQYRTVTRELALTDFTKVDLNGADTAEIHKSPTFKVTVEGRERDIENLTTKVQNQTLTSGHDFTHPRICIFCLDKPLHYVINMPALDTINVSGASRITAEGFESTSVNLELSGASRAELNTSTTTLNVKVTGASFATLSGTTSLLTLRASGSSGIDATNLKFYVDPLLSSIPLSVDASLSGASDLSLSGPISGGKFELSGSSRVSGETVQAKDVNADLSGASKLFLGDILTLSGETSGSSHIYYKSVMQNSVKNSTGSSAEKSQEY